MAATIAKAQEEAMQKQAKREYKRGKLQAISDMQHIVNAAIFQCRALGQRTPQLEELRAALEAMHHGVMGE